MKQLQSYLLGGYQLKTAPELIRCAYCDKPLGFDYLTDGTYVWIDGCYHYVEEHGQLFENSFIEHINRLKSVPYIDKDTIRNLRLKVAQWPTSHPVAIDKKPIDSNWAIQQIRNRIEKRSLEHKKDLFTVFGVESN